jgi:hypothetical protein
MCSALLVKKLSTTWAGSRSNKRFAIDVQTELKAGTVAKQSLLCITRNFLLTLNMSPVKRLPFLFASAILSLTYRPVGKYLDQQMNGGIICGKSKP